MEPKKEPFTSFNECLPTEQGYYLEMTTKN